ncbi:MAG: hypothetical protein POELPBGB_01968 [Bacteroidia bacterium]|nr:hypothetical protein [Bacteroidia bacterium]
MSENNSTQHEAEIARLNKIINVLLEQNDQLRGICSQLEHKLALHSLSEQLKSTNQATERNTDSDLGMKQLIHSTPSEQQGINKPLYSVNEQESGINQNLHSLNEQATGINQPVHSPSLTPIPSNHLIQPTSSATIPSNEEIYSLPEKAEPTDELISKLSSSLLSQKLIRAGNGTPQAAAKLLIHFHNGGSGLYTELIQLTGYSQGGLAKLLMNLRSKDLLVRASFQRYILTQKAKKLLYQTLVI